jgi:hypothetical protein
MHYDVENNVSYKNEIYPFRQFSFSKFHSKEYGDNSENVRDVSTQPMSPVEQWPCLASGMWPSNIFDISKIYLQ